MICDVCAGLGDVSGEERWNEVEGFRGTLCCEHSGRGGRMSLTLCVMCCLAQRSTNGRRSACFPENYEETADGVASGLVVMK